MLDDIKSFLPVAVRAAEEASKEILEVYSSGDFQTKKKDDNSPLTVADRRAHDAIDRCLRETGLPVLSEEGADIPYATRKAWPAFWLVDPLDGTKEFLKRNGEFTVNIALVRNNVPVLGVVAVPVKGQIFYATTGGGAHLRFNGSVRPLQRRSPVDLTQPGLRVVASRSHMNEETARFIHQLNNPILISAGSSLKFMAVAVGEADLYPRYVPCMEWDTAAADVIVNEVGLKTVDTETRQPLGYNKESLFSSFFICGMRS